jgi:hypothetical protein
MAKPIFATYNLKMINSWQREDGSLENSPTRPDETTVAWHAGRVTVDRTGVVHIRPYQAGSREWRDAANADMAEYARWLQGEITAGRRQR